MVVGILKIALDIPESRSLKDKRAVIRSLKARIESRFKLSVAEVGNLDILQSGMLAVACVSNDGRHADEVLAHVADFAIANPGDGSVASYETEILHLD
jgi:uncharacterized protein YlxP (DUF503 family)